MDVLVLYDQVGLTPAQIVEQFPLLR